MQYFRISAVPKQSIQIRRISQKLFKLMKSLIVTKKKNDSTYNIDTTSLLLYLPNYVASLMQQPYLLIVAPIYLVPNSYSYQF